jgi:hypothetical protein
MAAGAMTPYVLADLRQAQFRLCQAAGGWYHVRVPGMNVRGVITAGTIMELLLPKEVRMIIKIRCLGTFCAMLLIGCVAFSQTTAEKGAEDSATKWLAVVDAGDYGTSWDEVAQFFKSAVSKKQWIGKMTSLRSPLGKVISRKMKSATYKTSLPGAPDGQYVVIQYDSSFEHKKSAVETVTPLLDNDGQWRVSGYFIR